MDYNLKNRVALVTGSNHGIGKAIALSLAREGADVIICGRNIENLKKTKLEIESFGARAYEGNFDATNPEEVKEFFSEVVKRVGRVDILVNNVGGIGKFGEFEELKEDDWRETINLNFMSAVYVTQEALPWLKKSNQARIINISSLPSHQPGFKNPHYSAAKAALLNLSKHLANTLAKDNILVNAICPNTITGGGWEKNIIDKAARSKVTLEEAKEYMENEEKSKNPLHELGTVDDVAELAVFLSSDKAKFITGTHINIDGGTTRSI